MCASRIADWGCQTAIGAAPQNVTRAVAAQIAVAGWHSLYTSVCIPSLAVVARLAPTRHASPGRWWRRAT
jgi:hypothetical protein